jgi:site-specific recombinase XerD
LFISRKGFNRSISRQNADVILKKIAEALKWKFAFSTHSLRKTFGYQYYKETNNVVALQQMLNHAKPKETLIYIGIMKEEVDKERKDFSIDMDL